MYKKIKNDLTGLDRTDMILKIKDSSGNTIPTMYIPAVESNTDYQEYLEWSKTNTADPVDSLTWDDIRTKRDEILRSTDWTMTTGATVDQAQWAAYRQTIRDIPQTYKDKTPDDVVWPTQPSTKGPNT